MGQRQKGNFSLGWDSFQSIPFIAQRRDFFLGIKSILFSFVINIQGNHISTPMEQSNAPQFVFDPWKFLLIVAAAIFASSLSELISYFLLYRKEDYKLNKSKRKSMQVRQKNSTKN